MNIVEASLVSNISPHSRINQVDERRVRDALIQVFSQKGMPGKFRVDNGSPLGDPHYKIVAPLALWLIGMGVEVIWNPPRSPRENAKVERGQRTSQNWADIQKQDSYDQLQSRLNEVCHFQRCEFKVRRLGYKTRAEAFPGLDQPARVYSKYDFAPQRIYDYLAKCSFARKVSKAGQIRIYGQVYYINNKRKYQTVHLKFQSSTLQWQVVDDHGEVIKTLETLNFSKENLWNLSVCQRT